MTLRTKAWFITPIICYFLYTFLADTIFWSYLWMMMGLVATGLVIAGIIMLGLSYMADRWGDD